MLRDIPKQLKPIQAVSIFTAPGSYIVIQFLNNKEALAWLYANPDVAKVIPYIGIPFLIIFCLSCLFGIQGLLGVLSKLKNMDKNES